MPLFLGAPTVTWEPILTSFKHVSSMGLIRVRWKQMVRVNRLPSNCRVCHCSLKKQQQQQVWKMEIHQLDQIDEETDVSVQIHSFLEVTAVRYDENPKKMEKDVISVISWQEGTCLTVRLNQSADGTIDCMMHVPENCQTVSLESQYSVYLENVKHICEATCK